MKKDFLDEMIEERSRKRPEFRRLVDEATRRREVARRLAADRERSGFTQTAVAARMGTSQSVVSKLERGGDVKISTLQRYCAAIGRRLEMLAAETSRAPRARARR